MLKSAHHLKGYRLSATDGDVGTVDDFLFDDEVWAIRYLVADTGNWLPGRRVVLSPQALREPEWASRTLPVGLTRERIENAPGLDDAQPVSRQHETALHEYYGWTMYWTGPSALDAWPAQVARRTGAEKRRADHDDGGGRLRSVNEVCGYRIDATDGEIGHIEDLIVDDDHWWVPYAVVDTRNWLPGRKVLISPAWIREFRWKSQHVAVDLSRKAIKDSPRFDPAAPINRRYEETLYDYYGRPAYWAESVPGG